MHYRETPHWRLPVIMRGTQVLDTNDAAIFMHQEKLQPDGLDL